MYEVKFQYIYIFYLNRPSPHLPWPQGCILCVKQQWKAFNLRYRGNKFTSSVSRNASLNLYIYVFFVISLVKKEVILWTLKNSKYFVGRQLCGVYILGNVSVLLSGNAVPEAGLLRYVSQVRLAQSYNYCGVLMTGTKILLRCIKLQDFVNKTFNFG